MSLPLSNTISVKLNLPDRDRYYSRHDKECQALLLLDKIYGIRTSTEDDKEFTYLLIEARYAMEQGFIQCFNSLNSELIFDKVWIKTAEEYKKLSLILQGNKGAEVLYK